MRTYEDADVVNKQITSCCDDCPFRRKAVAGWLADRTPADYVQIAHSDDTIECHTKKLASGEHVQCAGLAIYRRNVAKRTTLPNITLPKDTETVFGSPREFLEHHCRRGLTTTEIQEMMHEAFEKRVREAMANSE